MTFAFKGGSVNERVACLVKYIFSFIIIFCFACFSSVFAQLTDWTHYTNGDIIYDLVEDGDHLWVATVGGGLVRTSKVSGESQFYNSANSDLPSNRVGALALDPDGILWVGSALNRANGSILSSFDGETWTGYSNLNTDLPSDARISSLLVDSQGTLWVGAVAGLYALRGSTWTVYDESNTGLEFEHIFEICEDHMGTLWMGSEDGLVEFDGETWSCHEIYIHNNYNGWITAMTVDPDGGVWVGLSDITDSGALAYYNRTEMMVYSQYNSDIPPFAGIFSLTKDNIGRLWVGTMLNHDYGRIYLFDGSTWVDQSDLALNAPEGEINVLLQDNELSLWTGTTKGLFKLSPDRWIKQGTSNSGLGSNMISSLHIDALDKKWIGTQSNYEDSIGRGLSVMSDEDWVAYNHHNSPIQNVGPIAFGPDENTWIGTGDGLVHFDGTTWTMYDATNSLLPEYEVNDLVVDSNGTLWIAAGPNLINLDGENWVVHDETLTGLYDYHFIISMLIDESGLIWLATSLGLASFDGENWEWHSEDWIEAMTQDNSGTLWFGLNDDLFSYDGVSWINHGLLDSLNNSPNDIVVDHQGTVWVSTVFGLYHYDGQIWEHFTTENAKLPTDLLGDMDIDAQGNLWIATFNAGVAVLSASFVTETEPVTETPPQRFQRFENYPNPFNPSTTMSFWLPRESPAILTVFDVRGRELVTLINTVMTPGTHDIIWDGRDKNGEQADGGVYLARLTTDHFNQTIKMVFLR